MPDTTAPAPPRLYFLDWLRAAAFGLLILYHVGMYYVSWDWHIKSPHAGDAIEPLMMLSSPWRLALLFLISGAATSMMLRPRSAGAAQRRPFLRERAWRLLPPLAFAMLVVVPPQSYFEVVEQAGYHGTYAAFMRLYLQAYHGFCDAKGDCLVMPTWNHMWFVAYLWVYSVWLWGLLKLWPSALDALARMAGRRLAGWGLLLWPIALLALVRCTLVGRFPQTHALVDDFYNHALYLSVFLLGAVLARWNGWAGFERWRWGALVASLLLWAVITGYFAYYNGDVEPPDWLRQLQRVGYGALQWLAIAAALGFAHRHWNRDHRWRATVVEAVFPVYLLHQTVIILLAWWLRPWQLAPAAEAPLLIAGTALACVAGYLVAARLGPLRVLFGLAARRRTGSALAAPAASSA